MTTKTYVQFLYPGTIVAEISTHEVADRSDPIVPDGAYGYSFFSRTEMIVNGEKLIGEVRDRSGHTYIGEVMTAEQIERLPGDYRILLSNMRSNDWPNAVRTVRGNFVPMQTGDRVISPEQPT